MACRYARKAIAPNIVKTALMHVSLKLRSPPWLFFLDFVHTTWTAGLKVHKVRANEMRANLHRKLFFCIRHLLCVGVSEFVRRQTARHRSDKNLFAQQIGRILHPTLPSCT